MLIEGEDNPQIVAIKVLKESASREAEEDFLREVDIMSTFKHPNILSLLGVVLKGIIIVYYILSRHNFLSSKAFKLKIRSLKFDNFKKIIRKEI